MADYSKHETDKFTCHKCGQNKMYPNCCDGKIKGFVCSHCGEVNYPTRDKLMRKNRKVGTENGES